eukprot:CAMPEP_0206441700 /NCGR_PEP_ID=MMETSP0324_2-20121206/13421_1 /ASSEMBLY_ACC=CAM_ASM_000836 /TAXON_ID=2866 /ORGANISM="Crypthecodinium cohnii, Strain Seligo" /LENGTH=210 /DNA_ID=CAMNT_0053909479 /DNA_START=99 /DNA_END=732 /DNA_ORIENTATION=+
MKTAILALGAFVLKASLSAALTSDEVDVTPEMLVSDDTCTEGDSACHVKLLQLKADVKVAQELEDAHPEGLTYSEEQPPNTAFFLELDENKDNEVQRSEVDAMLAHRIDLDERGVTALFQEADSDESGGLSMAEYNNAMGSGAPAARLCTAPGSVAEPLASIAARGDWFGPDVAPLRSTATAADGDDERSPRLTSSSDRSKAVLPACLDH